MKRVFVSSRLRADTPEGYEANMERARKFCRYVVDQGHNPYAPHIFYTQFMDDTNEAHRNKAFDLCLEELARSDELWVFLDPGEAPSPGVQAEIDFAKGRGIPHKILRVSTVTMYLPEGKLEDARLSGRGPSGERRVDWGSLTVSGYVKGLQTRNEA